MQYLVHKLTKNATIITFIIVFFSCEDNTALLMQINTFNENPVGTAYNIRMTYTDSANIKAKLSAPVHLDYSHLSFKYSEFPEGLKVIFYKYLGQLGSGSDQLIGGSKQKHKFSGQALSDSSCDQEVAEVDQPNTSAIHQQLWQRS